MNLHPDLVRRCVANLLLQHPELFDDEEARSLSIESETPAIDYLHTIEHRRREADMMAGAIAAQIAQLELRQERFVRQEKACRDIALKIMNEAALTKLVLPEATYSVRAGQQKLIIKDEDAIPIDFCRIKREPDKTAIKTAMMNGWSPPWAELSNAEPSLSVRVK